MIAATALLSPCGVVRQKLEFVFQVFASDTAIGDPLLAGSGSDGTATRLPRVVAVQAIGCIHHTLGQQLNDNTIRQFLNYALGGEQPGVILLEQCVTAMLAQPVVMEALRLQSSSATYKELNRRFALNSAEEEESTWQ